MRWSGFVIVAALGVACAPSTTNAKESLTYHGAFAAWKVFSLSGTSLNTCYAATQASRYHPSTSMRDRPVLYVVRYPKTTSKNTIEVRFGGNIKSFNGIMAKLIARRRPPRDSFALTTKNNAGFVTNPSDQEVLIAAMRKGREMIVVSQPGVGEILEDRYSMYGFTKALAKLETVCPGPEPVAPVKNSPAPQPNTKRQNSATGSAGKSPAVGPETAQ